MFNRISGLLEALFTDMQTTFLTIFTIGILICAVGVFAGDEHSAPKFKKGIITCVIGVIVFLLADPIIDYVKVNL